MVGVDIHYQFPSTLTEQTLRKSSRRVQFLTFFSDNVIMMYWSDSDRLEGLITFLKKPDALKKYFSCPQKVYSMQVHMYQLMYLYKCINTFLKQQQKTKIRYVMLLNQVRQVSNTYLMRYLVPEAVIQEVLLLPVGVLI